MPPRSEPSITKIALSLAGIVAIVIVVLLGASTAVGWFTGGPAVEVPRQGTPATVAAGSAASSSAAAHTTGTVAAADGADHKSRPAASAKSTAAKPKSPATAKTASAAKPAPTKPKHVAALPDRLKTLGGARQVVVVTAAHASSRDGTVELYDKDGSGNWVRVLSAPTRMGRNALIAGGARHEGSNMTPTGSWTMPPWGFGWASHAPSGSRLGWRQIKSTSWWSGRHDSTYNTWVTSSSHVPGENLKAAGPAYEFAIDSGFNSPANGRVIGRGSGIFIHVMHPGYTAGCISIPRAKMAALLSKLDPARHPRCVVGTTDSGTSTSLARY